MSKALNLEKFLTRVHKNNSLIFSFTKFELKQVRLSEKNFIENEFFYRMTLEKGHLESSLPKTAFH